MKRVAHCRSQELIAGILCDIAADELAVHTDGVAGYLPDFDTYSCHKLLSTDF